MSVSYPHFTPEVRRSMLRLSKVLSLTVLEGLETTKHSLAPSHYWLTRGLLAAEFPPWPSPPLLSQPDPSWLPRWVHVDASLSADAGSTWPSDHQDSPPQVIRQNLPPSSWITRARHDSRQLREPEWGQQTNWTVSCCWDSAMYTESREWYRWSYCSYVEIVSSVKIQQFNKKSRRRQNYFGIFMTLDKPNKAKCPLHAVERPLSLTLSYMFD